MQNHRGCIYLKQTRPLADGEHSPPLHFPFRSLSANCSVLLLTVALGSNQILAPSRLYHKGQKEEKTMRAFVDGWGVRCVCERLCSAGRKVV